MTDELLEAGKRYVFYETVTETMLKGGSSENDVYKVLISLFNTNHDDYTVEEINEIILRIHEGLLEDGSYNQKGRRNIQTEVENLIRFRGSGGGVSLGDIYNDLKLTTATEKAACRMSVNRLSAMGIIEKVNSGRTGIYRLIDSNLEETQFLENDDPGVEFPVRLPCGLNELCSLYEKNIIIVAGSKGAGKTALALNIAIDNQHNIPVIYLNSEMGSVEYTKRLRNFGVNHKEQIKFKTYDRCVDYHDLINGDRKIYIVDYLEIHDTFYAVADPIRKIHEKLRRGICFILIQKKGGADLGRGSDFSMEKSRLYLTMDFNEQILQTKLRIADAKFPKVGFPVRGLFRNIKVINGTRLSPVDDTWHR